MMIKKNNQMKIIYLYLFIDLHPGYIWHVLFIFIVFISISNFSFQGWSQEFIGSHFTPCNDCILLCLLVGTAFSKIYVLTSHALLSKTAIALSIIVILLQFPFKCMPSNEIWTSTMSPTRIAPGLIS